MSASNNSSSSASTFTLIGIPGLEAANFWLAFLLCSLYLFAVLGNGTIIYIIKAEQSLHEPMYLFLCMLAAIDVLLSTSTMPRMMDLLWFNSTTIGFDACLLQMFCIHSLSAMESTILLAMAFDRYVAICCPLRHAAILTSPRIAKIGLAAVIRGATMTAPFPIFIKRLPYCRSHIISHCYCEHMAVVKLACADTRFNNIYGIIVAFFIVGLDLMFISLSYVKILRAVLSLASKEEKLKAFSTCVAHLWAILVAYTPVVLSSIIYRFGHPVPPHVHILLANFYLLFPPMMNPIVYGVKTKQIRDRVLLLFRWKSF
uniref:Olfactory receptor n=1 Tax=Chrysemys picta bellii TaxID=8478 RepID=A0A8C3FPK8_CHRPI